MAASLQKIRPGREGGPVSETGYHRLTTQGLLGWNFNWNSQNLGRPTPTRTESYCDRPKAVKSRPRETLKNMVTR